MPLPTPLPLGGPCAPARNNVPLPAAPAYTACTAAAGGPGTSGTALAWRPPTVAGAAGPPPLPSGPTRSRSRRGVPGPLPLGGTASTPHGNNPCGRPLGSTAGTSGAPSSAARAASCVATRRAGRRTPAAPCTPCCETPPGAPESQVTCPELALDFGSHNNRAQSARPSNRHARQVLSLRERPRVLREAADLLHPLLAGETLLRGLFRWMCAALGQVLQWVFLYFQRAPTQCCSPCSLFSQGFPRVRTLFTTPLPYLTFVLCFLTWPRLSTAICWAC